MTTTFTTLLEKMLLPLAIAALTIVAFMAARNFIRHVVGVAATIKTTRKPKAKPRPVKDSTLRLYQKYHAILVNPVYETLELTYRELSDVLGIEVPGRHWERVLSQWRKNLLLGYNTVVRNDRKRKLYILIAVTNKAPTQP
jgi:hypothetical protein